MNIIITEKQGLEYAKVSGDKNKIHVDDLTGHNSHYGTKICHGTLVIINSLKKININRIIKKKNFSLNVKLKKFFLYNKEIRINKKTFNVYQKDGGAAEFKISYASNNLFNIKKPSKIYLKNIPEFKKKDNHTKNINILLNIISKYVGMIFPGEFSIISELSIIFNKDYKFSKTKIRILSKKKLNLPIIFNTLYFANYQINFTTFERPNLKLKKVKINNNLKKKIKKIKGPILIIGSSSGIGLELLNIFNHNKKIKIFATYNLNKPRLINNNINPIKLDLMKNFTRLKKIILSNKKLLIYYMATPKINIKDNSQAHLNTYKKFYVNFVFKILNITKKNKINFLYPSTTFTNFDDSSYVKAKLIGEEKLLKNRNDNIKVNIVRINEINTRQNLSLLKKNLPSFTEILNKDIQLQNKVLFI